MRAARMGAGALIVAVFLLAAITAGTQALSGFQTWLLQTGTPLHPTGANFEFAAADHNRDGVPDIWAIKKSETGANSTEVHILSGASAYHQFIVHTGTALHETGANFTFGAGDFDRDGVPDLYAIKMNQTGSGFSEVHVLSGVGFSRWLLNIALPLEPTDLQNWAFALADWNRDGVPDLIVIKKQNTGSDSTEVHILSGASGYRQFILHTGTALHQTDSSFTFQSTDYDRDGFPDLAAIKVSQTGSGRTEVHILSGASGFRQWLLQTATPLEQADTPNWAFVMADWDRNLDSDLIVIKKQNTGSNSTEVHVLGGSVPTGPAQIIHRGDTTRKVAYLSFDAGSDAGFTSMILDTLSANGIVSSFGITGRWAEQNPDLMRRIARDGHELINHTYNHPSFTGFSTNTPPLTTAERWDQLDRTESIVQGITGKSTKPYFRPPFGDYDDSVNRDVFARGYRFNLIWTVDSRGWQGISADAIVQRCLSLAEPGVIYIFHVGSASQDGPALQRIIDGLRASGYSFGTLSQFLR